MEAVPYKDSTHSTPLEAVESGVAKTSVSTAFTEISVQTQQLLQKQQQKPSESLQYEMGNDSEKFEEEENHPPDSEWLTSIKKKLEQAREDDALCSRKTVCIFRVPHSLREGDKKAYFPQLVSLGPYHHGQRRLRQMDRHKWRALHHVLERTSEDVELYLQAVRELEERARGCYEGSITLSSSEFVQMMVLDGCFVIELLQGAAKGFENLGYSSDDPVFAKRGSIHSIQRDMIMLENQLPLFILDRLLGLQLGDPDQEGEVAKLIPRFFDALMPTDVPTDESFPAYESTILGPGPSSLHCLDVFRRSLLRKRPQDLSSRKPQRLSRFTNLGEYFTSPPPPVFVKRRQQLIHCVTELREAGVKFKRRKTDNFWDINFKNGILQIPKLLIHYGTKALFLNLIAFEQCHPDGGNKITSYVVFMDNLINSHQDVAYLHYCGIIEHWLGSDAEVADLFNHLCQEVVFDRSTSYLSSLSSNVNGYYYKKWNAWRASLKHNYFSNPWAFISLVAAFILLLLTFLQTFYGVYAYYNPR
jgi:hypothetical protein